MTAHPEFGKELRRPSEVHENCYDCVSFYDGCQGWRASDDFECRHSNRLTDVLPGTCGQRFPPSRRRNPARPELASEPVEQDPPESRWPTAPEPEPAAPPAIDTPRGVSPASRPREPPKPGARTCGCGAALPKGKRFCDTCRTENRRRTKRRYMQSYRKQRSPAGERGCPFQCSPTPLAAKNVENAAR